MSDDMGMAFENKKKLDSEFGFLIKHKSGHWSVGQYTCENYRKMWHRLIWERFHGKPVPKGYVVHHIDGNPSNNCIMNLCIMTHSEHSRMHKLGTKASEETKRKISKANKGNQKLINSLTGRTIPMDVREKIRQTMLGLRVDSKNLTEYVEIRKRGKLYAYYENGNSKTRIKQSKYFDKLVGWAKSNDMSLTLHKED